MTSAPRNVAHPHHLEVPDLHLLQRVRGTAEVAVAAAVCHHHAELLECPQDHLRLGRIAGDIDARLEPHPHPHRRIHRVARRTRHMARRRDIRLARVLYGEPERVVDLASEVHLIEANQAGKDRQSGGVR